MKKGSVTFLGFFMFGIGVVSIFYFVTGFQDLFQTHLARYGNLFEKGRVGRCLYADVMMFLYIVSFLFSSLYYVVGGILLLCFVEFGRELGLFAASVSLVTAASAWLGNVSAAASFLPFLNILIPCGFIYCLTRKPVIEALKAAKPAPGLTQAPS